MEYITFTKRGIKINLKEQLKLEKKFYFIEYIFKRPFFILGDSIISILRRPSLWLLFEFVILIFWIFRKVIIHIFKNYPIIIDKTTIYFFILIAITYIYKIYVGQSFQEEYRKKKEEKLKGYLE